MSAMNFTFCRLDRVFTTRKFYIGHSVSARRWLSERIRGREES